MEVPSGDIQTVGLLTVRLDLVPTLLWQQAVAIKGLANQARAPQTLHSILVAIKNPKLSANGILRNIAGGH